MKLIRLFLITTLSLIFNGCNSDSDNSNSGTIVRYELISTSNFTTTFSSGTTPVIIPFSLSIGYLNESGGQQNVQIVATGNNYTKSVTMQTQLRPIPIQYAVTGYTSNPTGTVTMKIYVNNLLKGTQTVSIANYLNGGMFTGYLTIILE
jgi:hypothetical protein